MSGMILNIVPPTLFDFKNTLTGTGAGAGTTINIATRIDVSGYESGVLQVRLHTVSLFANDQILVDCLADGTTPDDGGTDFASTGASQLANGAIPFAGALSTTQYAVASLAGGFPGLLRVTIRGVHGSTQTNAVNAKLSIDLVLRTGGAAAPMAARMPGSFMGYR